MKNSFHATSDDNRIQVPNGWNIVSLTNCGLTGYDCEKLYCPDCCRGVKSSDLTHKAYYNLVWY